MFSCLTLASEKEAAKTENKAEVAGDIKIERALFKPFIERYILDELKALRKEQQSFRAEVAEKVAAAKLDSADRAINYTSSTMANIFYIITIAVSIIVLLGWKSLRDIKETVEVMTSKKVSDLILKYEKRLDEVEKQAKKRSAQISKNQKVLTNTNLTHSLWLRAGLEINEQEKINIYDEILEINPADTEALTYKAASLLELNEDKWALSLSNQAIKINDQYALAYWQRACAKAKLDLLDDAVDDILSAINLSETFKDELREEIYFEKLKGNEKFDALVAASTNESDGELKDITSKHWWKNT
jgi:uncharacterized pyridoxamine 5'-phosphate oxidase family protein